MKSHLKIIDLIRVEWYKLWLKEGCKIVQEDINKLFNFVDITDSYVLVKDKEKTKKVYIYEIEPVTFLNFSIELQTNILNLYNEFLRSMEYEFQIYISNQKINIENYISNIKSISKNISNTIQDDYIIAITDELEKEKIYVTKYYIIVALDRNSDEDISNVDAAVNKLNYIGCNVKRIKVKKELMSILYEGINKEVTI